MKRILGLAALLGHALSAATGVQVYGGARGGRGKRPVYGNAYFSGSRPTDARWWHDVNMPAQANLQMNAQLRRDRRGFKLERDANYSFGQNFAHWPFAQRSAGNMPKAFNPFYVAK